MIRVDPLSNTPIATVEMAGIGYDPIVIGDAPWISIDRGGPDNGQLVRISPITNTVDRVLVPDQTFGGGGDIVVVAGSVWVVDGYHNAVLRLPLSAFGA
jgi:hypothetical protein